jgi:hypothetical protein
MKPIKPKAWKLVAVAPYPVHRDPARPISVPDRFGGAVKHTAGLYLRSIFVGDVFFFRTGLM